MQPSLAVLRQSMRGIMGLVGKVDIVGQRMGKQRDGEIENILGMCRLRQSEALLFE